MCSYDEWRAKVEADLKGADFNKKVVWRTNEGFNVQPVYRVPRNIADFKTTDSLPGEYRIRSRNPYRQRLRLISPGRFAAESPKEANEVARDIITKGVTSARLPNNVTLDNVRCCS